MCALFNDKLDMNVFSTEISILFDHTFVCSTYCTVCINQTILYYIRHCVIYLLLLTAELINSSNLQMYVLYEHLCVFVIRFVQFDDEIKLTLYVHVYVYTCMADIQL